DVMIMPEICGNGRAEHPRGIHRGTRKRSAEQDVERDGRSDYEASDAPRPAFIHRCGMNHEHEKERENAFDQNSLPGRQVDGQLRSPTDDDVAAKKTKANQSRRDSAEALRNPK